MIMADIEDDVQIAVCSDEDSVRENINDFTKDGSSINSSHVAVKYENELERNLLLSHDYTSYNNGFYCYVCGKSFNFHYQLIHHKKYHKNHLKKLRKINCKYCGKDFEFKFVLNRHTLSCHSPNQTDKGISINEKLTVQTVPYDESIPESVSSGNLIINDSYVNAEKEKIFSIENVTEINGLECFNQTGGAISTESTIQAMSHNLMVNNYDLNMKNKKNIHTTANKKNSSDLTDASYPNNLAEKTATHTNVINELNVEEEPEDNHFERETKYFIFRKIHEYICKICKKYVSEDIHSFATHMISHKECSMHECTVCDIKFPSVILWTNHMLKHEEQSLDFPNTETNRKPTHTLAGSVDEELENHILVRETEYFIIGELPEYLCKICKQYVSADLHSFASHIISHRECSMHECIVCDIKFPSVIFWTNHMLNHEELSQNLPNSEISCYEVEPNTNISTNSEIMEPQVRFQSIPSKSMHTLTNQTRVDSRTFCSKHCNTIFSSSESYTNHENSHILKENGLKHQPNEMDHMKLRHRESNLNNRIDDREKSVNETLPTEFNTNPPSVSAEKKLNNSVNVITDNISELNCCKICYKQFANPKSLALHMRIHSKLKCQCCQKSFNGKGSYYDHMKCHNNFNIIIEDINSAKLKGHQHEKNHNNSELVKTNLTKKNRFWFPCDVCEKKYSTPDQLFTHRRFHCDIGPYLCKICKKSYSARYMWNRHLKSHYRKNKLKSKYNRLTCTSKSETSKIKNKTVQHQNNRTHNVCYICKKTFSTMENCNKHIKYFHKQLNITDLDTSANSNVNNKETKTVQQKSKLLNRAKVRRQVSNKKKNQCIICDKFYCSRAALNRHRFVSHTTGNNVKHCTICKKQFKHIYSLRNHLKNVHNKNSYQVRK